MMCEVHECKNPAGARAKLIWTSTKNSSERYYCADHLVSIAMECAKLGLAHVTIFLSGVRGII